MNQNDALIGLCQAMLKDPGITEQAGWQKLILIGEVGQGHAGMRGYSYNAAGECLMVSPRGVEELEHLHAVMRAESPEGRGWLKCMIRISSEGEFGADFEYDDPNRWNHTPDNYKQRIAEYAAMPV